MTKSPETVVIRRITPSLDNARFAIKRPVGGTLQVEADIFKDGHDEVAALLKWRRVGESSWNEAPMRPLLNDRWAGEFLVADAGIGTLMYRYRLTGVSSGSEPPIACLEASLIKVS